MLESDFIQVFRNVTFGPGRGVSGLVNNCRSSFSLTALSTQSFGTDWYTMMEWD